MCSLTLALTGLTTGLQMAGQYQQSRAQAAAYEAQAEAAYQNAKIQNKKGEQQAERYAYEQRRLDNQRRLVAGQQNAQAGASGIAGGVGSSLDIYNASMAAWNEDSVNLLNNQRNTIYDNYVGEVNLRNKGDSYMAQADAAKSAGNWGMIGTFLGGATSMIGMKGFGGGSKSASTATAQTPTAAPYQANALDAAMSGISGFTPTTRGVIQGYATSVGPKVLRNNPYSMANNGVYWKR